MICVSGLNFLLSLLLLLLIPKTRRRGASCKSAGAEKSIVGAVGVRMWWTCSICRASRNAWQIAAIARKAATLQTDLVTATLDVPAGWRVGDDGVTCPDHQ
jgi:hypothetical protein